MKRGRGQTMTHDYKRNGTTDLFAALNVATGEVRYDTEPRHRATEVVAFFKYIDLHVPRDLEVHVVLDNLSAHEAPRSRSGSLSRGGSDGTCISRRHRRRGSTSSSAGSTSSPNDGYAAAHSPASMCSSKRSNCELSTGTTTPSRSSGRKPPTTSSRRSAADGPHPPKPIRDALLAHVFDEGQQGYDSRGRHDGVGRQRARIFSDVAQRRRRGGR